MKTISTILILVLLILACDDLPDAPENFWNPLDPSNPDYVQPMVTITQGPNENDVINTDQVTISWQGNQNNMEYRYKLDEYPWSDYSTTNSADYDLLDDEAHSFSVQGKYASGVESLEEIRNFEVNAINPNAIFIYPKKVEVSEGQQFFIELMIDVEDSISAVSTTIEFDQSKLVAESVEIYDSSTDAVLMKFGGQLIEFHEIDNTNGQVNFNLAVVEGSPRNITGIGKIARINFRHVNSNAMIGFNSSSEFRDSENEQITLNYLGKAQIELN